MAKKETKVKKETKPRAPKYHLEINVNDVDYVVDTNDFEKSLQEWIASEAFPFAVKTRMVIRYSKGKLARQRNYFGGDARKLVNLLKINKTTREGLARRLTDDLA